MNKRVETLATAKELASKVASVLTPESRGESALDQDTDQVTIPAPLKLEAMDMDGLYMSITQVNKFLPGMVDDLLSTFFKGTKITRKTILEDGEVELEEEMIPCTPSEKKAIFESLAKFSLTDKRLEKEFGLLREVAGANGGTISLNQLNIIQLREVPGALDGALRQLAGPVREVGDSDDDEQSKDL